MLLISYILAAALELTIVVTMGRTDQTPLFWSYGFLLVSSLLSIPVETSTMGEKVRSEMKQAGVNIDVYDLGSNLLRCVIYMLVLTTLIKAFTGVLIAYLIAIFSLLLAVRKLK